MANSTRIPDTSVYGIEGDVWLSEYRRSGRLLPDVREALSHFEHLFQSAPVAFVVTDQALTVTDANRAACVLFNKQGNRIRGKPLSLFIGKSERKVFREIVTAVLKSSGNVVRPLCIQRGEDNEADMVATATAILGPAGEVLSIYWIFSESLGSEEMELL